MEGGLAREKASTIRRGAAQVFAKALGIPPAQAEAELLSSARFAFKNLRFAFFKKHDALGFLDWARGKFELILATNPFWPLDVVEMRMYWGGVDPKLFRLITHNDNMSSCKPDQGYYHELLEKTGKDPQECLMVGNDYRKDSPAQKAGIDVFLLSTLPRQKALWDKKGLYSGSFNDLQELLTQKSLVRDS
jgi:FMN phosphatase YigB (HAD superfamily)